MSEGIEPSPEELLAVAAEMAGHFPPPRVGTELVILDVHPHRAHAFWHVDEDSWDIARKQCGAPDPTLVIRLHDVTGIVFDGRNPHDTFDTIVVGDRGQVDINVWKDGRTYLGELGFRRPDGALVHLATSEAFDLPVSPPIRLPLEALAPVEPPSSAPAPMTEVVPVAPVGPWPSAEQLSDLVAPHEDAVEAFYARAEQIPSPITVAQQTMEIEVRDVPAEPTLAATGDHAVATGLPVGYAAPYTEPPIRLEEYLSYSSHSLGRSSDAVDVSVDLAIHGRIPAGRSATLFGHPVTVDAEGRFEFRQTLPHPSAVMAHVWRSTVPPKT